MLSDSTGRTALRIGHGETCCYDQHAILIRRKNMALTQEDLQQIVDAVNQSKGNDIPDLPTFKESSFYTTWSSAFKSLGLTGVIAIPNTTFDEWLYWFQEWGKAFAKNYNDFKDLVNQTFTELNNEIATINADLITLHQKDAEIEKEIDDKISGIISPNVIDNLATLKEKYPNGANGIWVSAEDGHKYGWINNAWTDLGIYQSVIIPDGSITNDKFAKEKDIFKSLTIIPNKYVATSGATINYADSPNFFVIKIPVTKGKLRLNLLTTGGIYVTATTADGNTVVWQKSYADFTNSSNFSRWGYVVNSTDWTVDFDIIGVQTTEKYLYITQPIENMSIQHVYQSLAETINDSIPYLDYDNVDNETIEELSINHNKLTVVPTYRQRLYSYDTTTGTPLSEESNSHAYFKINLPQSGQIIVPKTTLTAGQFILVIDDTGKVIRNFDFNYVNGTQNEYIYPNSFNEIVIDVDKLRASFDVTIISILVSMFQNDIINFSPINQHLERVDKTLQFINPEIEHSDFKKDTNYLPQLEILPNRFVSTSGTSIAFTTSPNYYVVKIPITSKGILKIPMINTGGKYLTATASDGTTLIWQKTFTEMTTAFSRYGFSVTAKEITVDLNKSGYQLEEKFLYVSQAYANQDSFYVKLSQETTTENLLQSTDTSNIVNQSIEELSESYNPLSVKVNYRQRNISYDTKTGVINSVASGSHATYILSNLPTNGSMLFEKSLIDSGQFMIFTDENDKAIINFDYRYASGERSTSFLSIQNGQTYFNFENAFKSYPTLAKIQLTLFQDEIFNFKPVFYNTTALNEVFTWANGVNNGDLTLTKSYPVLTGKTANVVLDNLLLGESVYDGQTVLATKQLGTQKIGIINETDTSISVNKLNQSAKTITVKRQDPTKNSGTKNVMLIGESTTEAQFLLDAINERLTSDATTFNLVGTRVRNNVHHEARSGWGAGSLHYVQSANGSDNSFYNPAKSEFDWAWYLTQNNITPPDIVVINFGLNDVNRYVTNGTTLSQTEHYNFFIQQIRAVKADTKIVIGLTHIYSSFGKYRHDVRRSNIATLLRQTIADFDNRESENIFVAPYFYNVDSLWDMQYQQIPLNDYQPTEKVDYDGLDAIHPSQIGYTKMSDVLYASIKNALG